MWKYKMKRNSKLAILIVLVTAAIFVWMPKGKKAKDISRNISLAAFDQTIPLIKAVPKKRTEFADWGRNPFAKLQTEKETSDVSELKLGAIMWGDKKLSASINKKTVSTGDKIDNKIVKQIERDRVILTDGINDYVLKLSE